MSSIDSLLPTLLQVQAAVRRFTNGDPNPYKACWSRADDVTICGGWGAYERGWAEVEPRLEWAASRWRGGHTEFVSLAMGASGDFAYTVWLEQGDARLEGLDEFRPIALRVTHIYRHEEDSWKIIHRHADALIEKIPTTAVLQAHGQQ
jgi:ketosteroid isomerase-like protein